MFFFQRIGVGFTHEWDVGWLLSCFWDLSISTFPIRGEPFSMCSQCEDWRHLIGRFLRLELGLGGLELAHYTIETRRSLGGTPTNFPVKPCLPSGRSVGRTGTTAGRNPLIRLLSIAPSSVCTWNQAVLLLEPYVWDNLIRPLHLGNTPNQHPSALGKSEEPLW